MPASWSSQTCSGLASGACGLWLASVLSLPPSEHGSVTFPQVSTVQSAAEPQMGAQSTLSAHIRFSHFPISPRIANAGGHSAV